MHTSIQDYNNSQAESDKKICQLLNKIIDGNLSGAESKQSFSTSKQSFSTSKIWHGHPVWFLEGNPIVGYHKLKDSVRLLFWSGQTFEESGLQKEGSFKAAAVRYTGVNQVNKEDLHRWLKKAKEIQWDYKRSFQGSLIRI